MDRDAENARLPRPPEVENATSRRPAVEQRGVVTDALIQTAQNLKEVGMGAVGGYLAAKWSQSNEPKDK